MSYRGRDRIFALLLLGLCVIGLVYAATLPSGAALFPQMLFIATAVLSTLLLIGTLVGPRHEEPVSLVNDAAQFSKTLVLTALYLFAMARIGYFTSSFLYIALLSFALGYHRVRVIVITSLTYVAFIYAVFVLLFNRPLPAEFFQRW